MKTRKKSVKSSDFHVVPSKLTLLQPTRTNTAAMAIAKIKAFFIKTPSSCKTKKPLLSHAGQRGALFEKNKQIQKSFFYMNLIQDRTGQDRTGQDREPLFNGSGLWGCMARGAAGAYMGLV